MANDCMATTPYLHGWTVVSLRPQNQHAGLRQAATRRHARMVSASPFRLQATVSESALATALACPLRIAVSPAAVRFAAKMATLHGDWLAVGDSTAKALRNAGARQVQVPQPQTAAGLLGLAALTQIKGLDIGLISAPDGLGLLEKALPERGARLHSAHVYRRQPLTLSESRRQQLLALRGRIGCLVSSQAAFGQFWQQFTPAQQKKMQAWHFVASSARLLHYLHGLGLSQVHLAENTRAPALLNALAKTAPRSVT
jgi:uroporphyrinogen-III synthase